MSFSTLSRSILAVAAVASVAPSARSAPESSTPPGGGTHAHVAHPAGDASKGKPHTRPAGSGVVGLDVYRDGSRVHLLTAGQPATGPAVLRYARSDDGGKTFAAAVPVGVGQPEPDPVHRGMDPQVAAAGDKVVAVWTTAGTEDRFGRGPLATAISADGGRTWQVGPTPADHGRGIGNAFLDLAADADGAFHCVWLDGRTGTKGLRYARSADGGRSWSANLTLVDKTCECCWNALATAPGTGGGTGAPGSAGARVWVLYRQASPRDMAVIASADGGKTWGPPSVAGGFGWQFNACPHVGGGVAPSADPGSTAVHAAVWTAKGGDAIGVYALTSPDAGKTWGPPTQLGTWRASHPDLAVAPGGRVAVAWDAMTEQGQVAVYAATSADAGKTWSEPRRLSDPNDGAAANPKLVPIDGGGSGGGFRAYFTQAGDGEPAVWRSAAVAGE
jgi:hypothetical protein